jgi:hypothetical protein
MFNCRAKGPGSGESFFALKRFSYCSAESAAQETVRKFVCSAFVGPGALIARQPPRLNTTREYVGKPTPCGCGVPCVVPTKCGDGPPHIKPCWWSIVVLSVVGRSIVEKLIHWQRIMQSGGRHKHEYPNRAAWIIEPRIRLQL